MQNNKFLQRIMCFCFNFSQINASNMLKFGEKNNNNNNFNIKCRMCKSPANKLFVKKWQLMNVYMKLLN